MHAYLQMVLSLRQTTDQLSQIHGRQIPLFILEPQAAQEFRLPMRAIADVPAQDQVDAGKVKVGQTPRKPQRVRYMSVADVLQWTFGEQHVVRSVTEGGNWFLKGHRRPTDVLICSQNGPRPDRISTKTSSCPARHSRTRKDFASTGLCSMTGAS